MNDDFLFDNSGLDDEAQLGGSNFLVSAVVLLRRQKKELQEELARTKARLDSLERQNAAFLNVNAERLLEKRG